MKVEMDGCLRELATLELSQAGEREEHKAQMTALNEEEEEHMAQLTALK